MTKMSIDIFILIFSFLNFSLYSSYLSKTFQRPFKDISKTLTRNVRRIASYLITSFARSETSWRDLRNFKNSTSQLLF